MNLPSLVDKLNKLIKAVSASAPLKTPTDLYKVFDKLLASDAMLNAVDQRCRCNIVENLLRVMRKCSTPLLTDTEHDDILKKREKQISESR